jgi:uncharacterized membrane protein
MYTIIGGDGKEYGPVSAEQVRSWVAGGRANMETKVKEAGGDTWKTVADFPDIISPSSAFAVPLGGAGILQEVAKLDIISCYERSWTLLKDNFWAFVGATIVTSVCYAVLLALRHYGLIILMPILGVPLGGGLYYYFLRKVRGLPTTVGDLFLGFTKPFLSLAIAGLLMAILLAVGFCCLVLPFVYLAVSYKFTQLLVVDKGLGFWEAMETSRKIITRQWWHLLGLLLLGLPFLLLGIAALLVGVFVAVPLVTGAVVYAYEDLCNPAKKPETTTAPTV